MVRLTRGVSVAVRAVFRARLRFAKTYEARDRVMALYGPVAMFALVVVWIAMVLAGFTMIYVSVEGVSWKEALLSRAGRRCSPSASSPRSASGPRPSASSRPHSGSGSSHC